MTSPRLAHHSARGYCAEGAAHLLREREARYPALITAGKLTQTAAVTGLDRARAIVAQWGWAMDPAGAPDAPWDADRGVYGFGAYNHDLAEETSAAAARARAIAERSGEADARELADLYDALAWWQEPHGTSGTARIVMAVAVERSMATPIAEPQRTAA